MDSDSRTAARAELSAALSRVGAGDRAALRDVYDLTAAKLFGVCFRISQDTEAAEDILQDVYLKVWNRASRFDETRASPITWLCTLARNAAIDWRRAHRGPTFVTESFAADVADARANAEQRMTADQERARIFACLDKLGARQGGAIRSAFFDGATYAELATAGNVPLGTMKSRVRRGLMQLKECLGDG